MTKTTFLGLFSIGLFLFYAIIKDGEMMGYPAKKEGHASRQTGKYTYSDYLKTPEDKRFELIEGDLLMIAAPNTMHQKIAGNIYFLLRQHLSKNKVGEVFIAPTDVVLDQFNVLEPDVLFILNERKEIITKANIQGAPDLVIEIISPTTASKDLITKKKFYAKFGVKEYWVVDPENQLVEVYTLEKDKFALKQSLEKKGVISSAILPTLKLQLADIFSK